MSTFVCCFPSFHRGFQMTFENGWTISVQFGEGNYCSGRKENREGISSAVSAECAVWDSNGKWYRLSEHDDVRGHMTTNEVGELIQKVMGFERA